MEPLRAGQTSELIIKFTNPTQHQTTITIFDLNLEEQAKYVEEQKLIDVIDNFEQAMSLEEVIYLSIF